MTHIIKAKPKTKDVRHIMMVLGHERTVDEACQFVENGFEYINDMDDEKSTNLIYTKMGFLSHAFKQKRVVLNMPTITIEMYEGRTLEQKSELVREITASVSKICKVRPEQVTIIIHEMPRTNYAVGGIPYSERKQS